VAGLQAASSLVLAAGLGGVYLCWRRRAVPMHAALLLGAWGLVALGLAGWSATMSADTGLARGMVLAMLLGLCAVAAHSLGLAPRKRAGRQSASKPSAVAAPAGNRLSGLVRCIASLTVAPALGLALAVAWRAHGAGGQADRIMTALAIAVVVQAVALVIVLASTRPLRTMLFMAAMTAAVLPLVLDVRP
jgi:hypothetical protein